MKLIFFLLQKRSRSKRSNTLILLDPHGDLVNEVKTSYLNRRDRERLVVLDSHLKKGMTYSINPLEVYDKGEENIQLMSQQLVKAFEETVSSRVSTNMGTLLQPCIAVLMREEGSTLADLQRFMNDGHNDDLVALGRQSPVEAHRTFFERDFYDKQQFGKTKSALSARIQFLLNNTTFYNLVCAKSTVNLEKEINSGKIILFNLAK